MDSAKNANRASVHVSMRPASMTNGIWNTGHLKWTITMADSAMGNVRLRDVRGGCSFAIFAKTLAIFARNKKTLTVNPNRKSVQ
jgi:hypothetical protein